VWLNLIAGQPKQTDLDVRVVEIIHGIYLNYQFFGLYAALRV
jgi:hypothetical protein